MVFEQIFFWSGWLCFPLATFMFPWFMRVLIKFWIILGLVLEFIFEVKVLQEDFLASLMVYQVLDHCYLHLLRFSDEGVCFEFPKSCSLSCLCTPLKTMICCGFGDSFIGYGNEGIGKIFYGFVLICISFWN